MRIKKLVYAGITVALAAAGFSSFAAAQAAQPDLGAAQTALTKIVRPYEAQTPNDQLIAAAKSCDLGQIQTLLSNKGLGRPDVNARDKDGETPLIWASAYDCHDAVNYLLSQNADAGAQDNAGQTALMASLTSSLISAIDFQKANPSSTAAQKEQNYDASVAHALIHALNHPNLDAMDKDGETALMQAAFTGPEMSGVVKDMIKTGANPKLQNAHYEDACEFATAYEREALGDNQQNIKALCQ